MLLTEAGMAMRLSPDSETKAIAASLISCAHYYANLAEKDLPT
jgi:hypothetical protein